MENQMSDFKTKLEAARDRLAGEWMNSKDSSGHNTNKTRLEVYKAGFDAAAAHLMKAIKTLENIQAKSLSHNTSESLVEIGRWSKESLAEITKGLGEVE